MFPETKITFDLVTSLPAPQESGGFSMGDLLPAAMMLVAALLLMNSYLRRQKAKSKQPEQPTDARARAEAIQAAARGKESLQAVLAESEQLAQRLAAHVDTKAALLEKLIADADDRLAKLEAAESRSPEPQPQTLDHAAQGSTLHKDQAAKSAPAQSTDPLRRRIYQLADQGKSSVEIAQATNQPTGQVELILALRSA
ncbi:MAG: hypothetical protein AAGB51_11355 [Planctomycetota bacterium]